jgi:hypothetical protein
MVSDSLIIVKKSNGTYNRHTTEAGVCILKVLFSRSRKESQTIRLTGSPIVCKHAQRTRLGAHASFFPANSLRLLPSPYLPVGLSSDWTPPRHRYRWPSAPLELVGELLYEISGDLWR